MSLQPPFKDAASNCIYLDEKTPCGPEYYGYPIKGGLIPDFPNDYDALVQFLASINNASYTVRGISEQYSCQADVILPQMSSMRYQTSFLCAKVSDNIVFFI
jgi:hypothetical protein